MIVILHVDDLIVAGKVEYAESPRKVLNTYFPTKDFGELAHYYGCSIPRAVGTVAL